ncbi:MAG TPA: TonB-dependent receptor [Caulobacteraceae bacterium]|nr:TonB-dependent receptor [Caulobacteraceae bacterium]
MRHADRKTGWALSSAAEGRPRLRSVLAGAALSFGLAPAIAAADDATHAQPSVTNVGEIVVTANKRAEPLKTVAAAVQAVPTTELKTAGVTEMRDLSGLVPGLTVSGEYGSGGFILRGISSGHDINPTTGLQIDGAPVGPVAYGAGGAYALPEIDPAVISRIEVLKGPQGTLYGGSTLGGIVQFVTRQPNLDHMEGDVTFEGFATEHGDASWKGDLYVSAPLVKDKLAVSLAAWGDDLGGFIDDNLLRRNAYNTHHSWGGRAAILWQVNPDFRIEVSDLYSQLNSFSDQLFYGTTTQKPYFGDLVNNVGTLPAYNTTFNMVEVNADYNLHWADLAYIGTYQTDRYYAAIPDDLSSLTTIVEDVLPLFGGTPVSPGTAIGVTVSSNTTKITQEVRLTSPDSGRVRWLVGGFFNHESTEAPQTVAGIQPDQTPVPGPVGDLLRFDLATHLTELAAFGDLTFYITPKLDVTGGVRVGHIDQDYRQLSSGSDFVAYNVLSEAFGLSPTPADTGLRTASETFETWLASLRYHFTPGDMVYFRFATGYRPGGPNDSIPGIPAIFLPDKTYDYEAGWKVSFWDNRGYFDLNLFDIDWRNIQVQTTINGLSGETNGGTAVSRGVEASLDLQPVKGLSLHAGGAYDDARYTQDLPGGLGLAGDPLPNAAKWTGSLSANYEWPLVGEWRGFVGAQVRFVGARNADPLHDEVTPNYTMPAYTTADLQLGVRHGGLQATLFIRNVGDERAQLSALSVSPVASYVVVSRPRTYGVTLSDHF